jgi:hypothetical protein
MSSRFLFTCRGRWWAVDETGGFYDNSLSTIRRAEDIVMNGEEKPYNGEVADEPMA